MVALVLGAAGSALGAGFGGTILGLSGAAIGGMIGSAVGSVADAWIVGSMTPNQRVEGARLESLRVTSATEGANVPRLFGRMKLAGNIIWATDFIETFRTTTQGGGKGGGGGVTTTTALYSASFAVALCEGPITGIGRIWADGKPMDMTGVTWRWFPGDEAQTPDPFISAKMGAANTPAYRGTAYVVLEELDLSPFGNRLPQTLSVHRCCGNQYRPRCSMTGGGELGFMVVEAVAVPNVSGPPSREFSWATYALPGVAPRIITLAPSGPLRSRRRDTAATRTIVTKGSRSTT